MKILLIGGNGYIGCRLYQYLQTRGYQVDNVDLCLFGKVFSETIVCDYKYIPKSKLREYSHIILLAGHSCPSTVGTSLIPVYKNNVRNFITLIEKLSHNQELIYASTAAIYGNSNELKFESDKLDNPVDYYTWTKQCIEQIASLYPIKSTGLRFGTVGGFSANFRSENLLNSMSVSAFNHKEITVSNPNLYRSVLGISDLCIAIDRILVQGIKKPIYNLVSETDTIFGFGYILSKFTNSRLIENDSMKTGYSFNCSSRQFENDYNFKFCDTIETIYKDITENLHNIEINEKRSIIHYD